MGSREQLGEFEQLAMLVVLHLGENAYGTTIREELERQASRTVTIGALYSTLERLEGKGFLNSELGESTPERGGRAKKFFKITGKGQKALVKSVSPVIKLSTKLGIAIPEII